jgi:hypothetical protein
MESLYLLSKTNLMKEETFDTLELISLGAIGMLGIISIGLLVLI